MTEAILRNRRRRWARVPFATGAVVVGILAWSGIAGAHAQLDSTDPSQSAVLLTPPRQVVLHFDQPVEINFGSVRVFGPSGKRVDQGGTHHPTGQSDAVAIPLPSGLPDGTYVVAWRVISADSHPVHGAFLFSVGSAAGSKSARSLETALGSATGSTTVGVVYGVIRFAVFASMLALIGTAALVALVWPAGAKARRIRRILWRSWGTLLVVSLAAIAVQGVYAASLPLSHVFSPSLFDEVLHTRFGEVTGLRVVLLVVLVPVLFGIGGWPSTRDATDRQRARWWIAPGAVLFLLVLSTPGLSGHASTTGNATAGMALDLGHLAAASFWLGGLVVLAAILLPGMPAEERPPQPMTVARRFSPYAVGAVAVVVTTGVLQSVRQVGSIYALLHTAYGLTLVAKVSLVAVMIAVGAVSRRLVVGRWTFGPRRRPRPSGEAGERGASAPAAVRSGPPGEWSVDGSAVPAVSVATRQKTLTAPAEGSPPRRRIGGLSRSVFAELVVAAAVLAVTSLLVNAVPAGQAAAQPFSQSFNVLGDQINAIIDPARVGSTNQFHFYVLGSLGQPVAVPELDVAMSLPGEGIGPITVPVVVVGPGHYQASHVDIPLAGSWTVKLTVRTSAIDEQEVFATVPVH